MTHSPKGLAQVVDKVRQSKKYQAILPSLVSSIAEQELAKGRSIKAAVKATKRQLHQSAAAYQLGRMDYSGWMQHLADAHTASQRQQDETIWLDTLTEVMAAHASTRERLPLLEQLYGLLFDTLPAVETVLDIACGLNPLSIPWMASPSGILPFQTYLAWDIFEDQVDFLNHFFALAAFPGEAEQKDALHAQPPEVDLVLLLKTIPCLEQVQKNAGLHLLDRLQARYILLSYPVVSLGGKQKGMVTNYEEHFAHLMQGRPWIWQQLPVSGELAFLIQTETA